MHGQFVKETAICYPLSWIRGNSKTTTSLLAGAEKEKRTTFWDI